MKSWILLSLIISTSLGFSNERENLEEQRSLLLRELRTNHSATLNICGTTSQRMLEWRIRVMEVEHQKASDDSELTYDEVFFAETVGCGVDQFWRESRTVMEIIRRIHKLEERIALAKP